MSDTGRELGDDSGMPPGDGGVRAPDATAPPDAPEPRDTSAACVGELCWTAGSLAAACGEWPFAEDFSSERYGVHAYTLRLGAGVRTTLRLAVTGGTWSPALIIQDETGSTVHDGERSTADPTVLVEDVVTGRGASEASLSIVADVDRTLTLLLSSWAIRDGDFAERMPGEASYRLTVDNECEDAAGGLLSPPNFDPDDVAGGYFLLPHADPAGLYTRRADGCSRGTKLLVDVIYTTALRWSQARPDLPGLDVWDMNEGACSTVDHATHNDGTHVDLHVECGTEVSCADDSAAVTLAQILVDTGAVCGILFNDEAVQSDVNSHFGASYAYEPWRGRMMRTVSGHTHHFHVRVKKPDGTCN